MARPLLAMTLLTVMAGASAWVLWPASPTGVVTPLVRGGPAPTTPVPTVHLERLARKARGVDPDPVADPFRGRPSPLRGPAAVPVTAGPGALVTPTLAEPPRWPHLELIGLAEGQEHGRPVRTAIVSGPAGVLHARAGDVLEEIYRVERVEPDGADVRLLPEDRVLRLALRP